MYAYRPRYNMKENRIPIGKKRENLEKIGDVLKSELGFMLKEYVV